MVLTKGDDFPIHQTSEPVAYSGADRNFYDRYFFNGYGLEGEAFFALAFGVYPHLNIADASFCLVIDGVQTDLHASRWLGMERMDLEVGPISLKVMEPLRRLAIEVEAPGHGVRASLVFTGRAFPVEEPRFVRRMGPRLLLDYTRLTQNGRYEGWIERDGVRVDVAGFVGTRDRSWGIRPVGARDPQEAVPPASPQFFWIWAPANFEKGSFFFHTNDDGMGAPWNRRAVWAEDGASADRMAEVADASIAIDWKAGRRHARRAVVTLKDARGVRRITYEPLYEFFMLGLGYGHPVWGHGLHHGQSAVEREDRRLAEVDATLPHHLHVQALCRVTAEAPTGAASEGRGILEQLAVGPHPGHGLAGAFDPPP